MTKKIGIIGFGTRASQVIRDELKFFPEMELVAISDIDLEKAKENIKTIPELNPEKINLYEDAIKMLDNEQLDGVFVGTRCDLHAKYAIEVLNRNIHLFLEKPVVTNMEDYEKLKKAVDESEAGGITSFPLRITALLEKVKEIYDSGVLGTLSQVQAYNNVTYGRIYFKNWYRFDDITGGLFLQKATHDIDYINYVLGMKPVEVCAVESKRVYKGDKPEKLKCVDCEEYETCYESTKNIKGNLNDNPRGEYCSYAKDTGNHDSATIIMCYENGLHTVYTQNFVVRQQACKRGMRLIGQEATLDFDWSRDEVFLYRHDRPSFERFFIKPAKVGGHSGGDYALMRDFLAIMNGDKSVSSLHEGLSSAYICMKARESAQTHKFIKL